MHSGSLVALALLVFGTVQLHADIWNTAYYATATEIVHTDLNIFVERVGALNSSDSPTDGGTLVDAKFCDKEKLVADHLRPNESKEDDRDGAAVTSIEEFRVVARAVLSAVASSCADQACATAFERLSIATGSQDLLSEYVVDRIQGVMCARRDLVEYKPELAEDYPEVLPRPYPYTISQQFIEFDEEAGWLASRIREKIAIDLGDIRHRAILYAVEPIAKKELEYSADGFGPQMTEPGTFAEALTDFLLVRASQEVLYYLIRRTNETPEDERHAFVTFLPNTTEFLEKSNSAQIATLVPALRSAVGDDMRGLPVRLMAYNFTDYDIGEIYDAFELIRNGLAPGASLARLAGAPSSDACGSFSILGIVAREWAQALLPSGKTTIGGLDQVALHHVKLKRNGASSPQLLYIRNLSEQVNGSEDVLLDCYSRTHHRKNDDLGLTLSGHSSPLSGLPSLSPRRETDDMAEGELADLITGLFLRLEQMHRLLAGEPEVKNEESASSVTESVPISEVLRLTIDTVELALDAVPGRPTAKRADGTDDLAAVKLWMQAYHATVENRFVDAVAAGMRYVHAVPANENAEMTRVRDSIIKIEPLLTLGANLLEAESGDELQAALYASTAPVGSSVLKSQPGRHVTIGAYVGVSVGGERKISDPDWDMHLGAALPIGVELTFGPPESRATSRPCCPFGIFLSPVDLGVVANLRINDILNQRTSARNDEERMGSDAETPKVEPAIIGWEQLLAPSAYAVLRLSGDLPMALAVGVQYSPKARKQGNREVDVLRMSVMLAVDVTLFRFSI